MPVAARTVERRISDMAANIREQQTFALTNATVFSIAADECVDINDIPRQTVVDLYDTWKAFVAKLTVYLVDVETTTFRYFKRLKGWSAHHSVNVTEIAVYMQELKSEFSDRFQDFPHTGPRCWASLPEKFDCMKKVAFTLLSTFGSTYLREQIFSHMKNILNPHRSRLTTDHSEGCVQLKVSRYTPDIATLSKGKQGQGSH
ncbi:uncharacterized protein LOC121862627 [Homarus americanus]|uniref:uncharacterized protein LOC121862627 n=1 Tax=Homarus americanus TaxID=6706 RepID=UPI001C455DF9|nr:uncharacterized protein LOC121862627 [Homarus americanus]